MSILSRIFKSSAAKAGWTAVYEAPEGVFGVSIAAPAGVGVKPKVMKFGALAGKILDSISLTELAKSVATGDFGWAVTLNRKDYKFLVIEEPAVNPDEMDESVRWAVGGVIDFPLVDAEVAWMKIPTEKLPNRRPHIYVAATQRGVVDRYRAIFKDAQLPLLALDVQETAFRNIAALASKSGEGLAFLAVGRQGVQFTVTFQGEMYLDRFTDDATWFADTVDPAAIERANERIVLQVKRSIDFIGRTLPFVDISRVLLAPMPANIGLRDRIAENLTVPVEPLDLGSILDLSSVPSLSKAEAQVEYLVALGAALRFENGRA